MAKSAATRRQGSAPSRYSSSWPPPKAFPIAANGARTSSERLPITGCVWKNPATWPCARASMGGPEKSQTLQGGPG